MFGSVSNPLANTGYGGLSDANGPINFISNIIQFIVIAGGILALINLVFAGFQYIQSSGDTKGVDNAIQRINMSLLGLVVMALSYVIVGLISRVLFGREDFLTAPQIWGP